MRLTNVAATPAFPPEYSKTTSTPTKAVNEMDSIVISDDARTVSDWSKLFRQAFNTGKTDDVFSAKLEDKGTYFTQYGDLYEYGADTYMKLKGQIDEKFSGDEEKKKLYTLALNDAFGSYIGGQSFMATRHLAAGRKIAEIYEQYGSQSVKEHRTDPLANHEDFNADEMAAHFQAVNTDFVKAFTDGAKNGLSAAWENVQKVLGGMQTTSVNQMSFNDMKLILAGLSTASDDLTGDIGVLWTQKYNALANNSNLSDFMRSVFARA